MNWEPGVRLFDFHAEGLDSWSFNIKLKTTLPVKQETRVKMRSLCIREELYHIELLIFTLKYYPEVRIFKEYEAVYIRRFMRLPLKYSLY